MGLGLTPKGRGAIRGEPVVSFLNEPFIPTSLSLPLICHSLDWRWCLCAPSGKNKTQNTAALLSREGQGFGFSPCFSILFGIFIARPGKDASHLGFPSPKSNKRGDGPPNPTPWGCDRACPLGQVAPGESRIGLQEGGSTWGFLPGRLPSCTAFAGPQPADLAPSPLLSQLQARASKGPALPARAPASLLLPFCSFALGTWEPVFCLCCC